MNQNLLKKFAAVCISAILLVSTLVFSVCAETGTTDFTVKIVHTNDIHSRIEEDEKSGYIGIERLSGIIDEFTVGADISLALDSGDTFHGQSIATVVKGESVARLMRECGYTAMTPGNHDWSYGKDRLKELGTIANTPILAGNVVDENGDSFFDNKFVVKESTKNGKTLKIGIFGVIDPTLYSKTTPSNVEGLKFNDAEAYAKQAVKELQNQGCNVIIALSHTYEPEKLAAKIDGVDLWLCGHEHKDINTTVETPNGKTAYVVESGYYLTEISLIELDCTVETNGEISVNYNRTAVDYTDSKNHEKNENVTNLLKTINSENAEVLTRKVGQTPVELDGVWEHLRIGQTNLGNIVTDAYLDITGADVAFENAGGIRASVKAGDVTYGDIIGVSPYGNYIVTKQITGKELREILETSISIQLACIEANNGDDWDAWPSNSGSYLQVGGVSYEYDPALPTGARITSIKVGENELDNGRLYTVATNNYVAESALYSQLANAAEIGQFSACDEALIDFFAKGVDTIEKSTSDVRVRVVDSKGKHEDSDTNGTTVPADDENADSPKSGVNSTVVCVVSAVLLVGVVCCVTIWLRHKRN